MENTRVKIFLSHAHEDKEIAEIIGNSIGEAFNNMISVFRSTDQGETITIGDEFKNKIRAGLSDSVATIILLSHASIKKSDHRRIRDLKSCWSVITILDPVLAIGRAVAKDLVLTHPL